MQIEVKLPNYPTIKTVFIEKRIDANTFACKSAKRKRKADLIIHIDYILTDVSECKYSVEVAQQTNQTIASQDEFDGLCQTAQIGENPFKCSIMCSNSKLNEVNQ